MSVDRYKRLHATWIDYRADWSTTPAGRMPDEEEGQWAERLDKVWRDLNSDDRQTVEEWLARQAVYRTEHGMDEYSGELTPEEQALRTFEGNYQLIVAESDAAVVFQINGKDVQISNGVLLEVDEDERKFWLSREDAEAIGLIH